MEEQPKRFVLSRRRRHDELAKLRKSSEAAAKACAALMCNEDLPSKEVNDISDLTTQWLEQAIAVRVEAVKRDNGLISTERASRLEQWRYVKKEAMKQVSVIQSTLKAFPEIKWQKDVDGNFFVSKDEIERVAEARATLEITPLAFEHWRRANEILEHIRAFRQWEEDNGLTHPLLKTIANCNEIQFLCDHVDGLFSYSPFALKFGQKPDINEILNII